MNQTDTLGYTAAMWAAEMGHKEMMDLILNSSRAKKTMQSKLLMTADDIFQANAEQKSYNFTSRLLNIYHNNKSALDTLPIICFSAENLTRKDSSALQDILSLSRKKH